jgi:hypothetical protein
MRPLLFSTLIVLLAGCNRTRPPSREPGDPPATQAGMDDAEDKTTPPKVQPTSVQTRPGARPQEKPYIVLTPAAGAVRKILTQWRLVIR